MSLDGSLNEFQTGGAPRFAPGASPESGRLELLARKRRSEQAFTLVEIMIAIAIFSGVLLAIYSSWTAILRSTRVGLKAAAEAQRTRIALRAIEESLGSATVYAANMDRYVFLADTSRDYAELSFVAQLPSSFPGSGLFGDQVIRRVIFSVEPGTNGNQQLVLRQIPLLEPPDAAATPYTIVLAPEVNKFAMQFLDTNKFEWVDEWLLTNRLPAMVRVEVEFGKPHGGPTRPEDMAVQTVFLNAAPVSKDLQFPLGRGRAFNPIPTNGGGVIPPPPASRTPVR